MRDTSLPIAEFRLRLMEEIMARHLVVSRPIMDTKWWQFWRHGGFDERKAHCDGLMEAFRIVRDTP